VAYNYIKVYGKHTNKMGFEFQHIKFSTLQLSWSHSEFDYNRDFVGDGNNGIAQFLLSPVASNVPNGIDNLGGPSAVFTSNIALVNDLHNYNSAYFPGRLGAGKEADPESQPAVGAFGLPLESHGRQATFIPVATNGGAQYLLPDSPINRNMQLAPSFFSLLAMDGITINYDKKWALDNAQEKNFVPRFGFVYQFSQKLVMRGALGVFFGGFENQNGNNQGNSYPYQFNFACFIPDSQTPITISNVSAPGCNTTYTFELGFSCPALDPALVDASGIGWTGLQYNF
jgi:hypothetical protein